MHHLITALQIKLPLENDEANAESTAANIAKTIHANAVHRKRPYK